jgi:hypothetical protein
VSPTESPTPLPGNPTRAPVTPPPSADPTAEPSPAPSAGPTPAPTELPTELPTPLPGNPTRAPTTPLPSAAPSALPTFCRLDILGTGDPITGEACVAGGPCEILYELIGGEGQCQELSASSETVVAERRAAPNSGRELLEIPGPKEAAAAATAATVVLECADGSCLSGVVSFECEDGACEEVSEPSDDLDTAPVGGGDPETIVEQDSGFEQANATAAPSEPSVDCAAVCAGRRRRLRFGTFRDVGDCAC